MERMKLVGGESRDEDDTILRAEAVALQMRPRRMARGAAEITNWKSRDMAQELSSSNRFLKRDRTRGETRGGDQGCGASEKGSYFCGRGEGPLVVAKVLWGGAAGEIERSFYAEKTLEITNKRLTRGRWARYCLGAGLPC